RAVSDRPPIPEDVQQLADERERARDARDYDTADALRERIRGAGFEVTDTPEGPSLAPVEVSRGAAEAEVRPEHVTPLIDRPPTHDVSFQWVVEGWPEDVARGIASFDRVHAGSS